MLARPIRVLLLARAVYPLHGFGGIERHVFHLVTHLVRQEVDVKLVVGRVGSGDHAEQLHSIITAAGLAVDTNGYGSLALRTLPYDRTSPLLRPNGILGRQINYPIFAINEGRVGRELVRRQAVDIVHTQGLCAFGWAWTRRSHHDVRATPFIANPHGLEEYRTPDWRKRWAYMPFRALYSWGHRAAERVIATDACTKDDLPHYLGVDPHKVVVIPSAIDVEECLGLIRPTLQAELRARFGLGEAAPVLLSVGRIERNKGYHILLDALHDVRESLGPAWRWLLVGIGKEQGALQTQAQALGLLEHVIFVGALNDAELHSLYEEVDLFVHPTLYEGSSLVTLEAMIHRLPVVASAAGGIPDKVFPHHNGLLVSPGDRNALANALQAALQARPVWRDWGRASAQIVRETFSWPLVARQTKEEYVRMVERANRHQVPT